MRACKAFAPFVLPFVIGIPGCFLPLPFNENGSPPISGIVQRSDSRPDVGRRLAISSTYDDSTCSEARASATTDSAGRFALPHTLVRRRGILLIPPFERFWNSFTLCSATSTDTLMRRIYEGRVGLGVDAPLQTISCYEWMWQGEARMTCSARDEAKVVEGGRWVAGDRRGRYRLVLTEELARARGFDRPVPRPHAYVLWIEETEAGLPLGARETVRLPIDDNVTAVSHAEILERNGRFYATFPGYKKTFMNDFASAELRFELGPPGQVTKVAGP
ncbi:MAG TPA: hypothetical protein VJ650_16925 [Gemmatimonadaceae bacterium]|nr:hypothetical protein [Gemmatimonadaceae bacterium]